MENDMAIQKIKLSIGTVYLKMPNGIYYFRYQVNGARKAISLKTRNKQQAIKEAEQEILSMTTSELCYILDEMAVLLYKTTKLKRKKHGVFLTENFNRVYSKR